MRLGGDLGEPIRPVKRNRTWKFVPADKVSLVIGHVEWGEKSTHQELELLIRVMDHVILVLSEVLKVVEGNSVSLDSNFFHELAKLTVRTFAQVSQESVLELRALLHVRVVGNLRVELVANDVLVTEHVSHAPLVDLHSILVSILHRLLVMTVPVLELVISLL